MPIVVNATCEECTEYIEESAGIDDGVNVLEVAADGWAFDSGAAYCPEHAHLADS
jgi:hypothetical protein